MASGHLVGVLAQGSQDLRLGSLVEMPSTAAVLAAAARDLAHVGGGGGDQLLVGDLEHRAGLDVEDLGVVLHLDLVAAQHLGLGQDAELLHQGNVLRVLQRDHRVGGCTCGSAGRGARPRPPMPRCSRCPLKITRRCSLAFDPGGSRALKVGGTGGLGHELLQALGDGGVQDRVRVGWVRRSRACGTQTCCR